MNKKIAIGILAVIIAALVIYNTFDKIALFALSKFYDLDIIYKTLNKNKEGAVTFENIKVINKKMRLGFYAQQATIKPVWKHNFLKTLNFDFKLKDVHFIKGREEGAKAKYDTLSEIVAVPFEGRWTYRDVSGEAEVFSNGLSLKKFLADGKEIRLTLSGDIFYNDIVDVEISIYFSKEVLKDIPPEVHSVMLTQEPNEWKSISVKLKGNLGAPAIQISGKLFRLNIGTMTVSD